MEDISRELERELKRSRPKPFKKSRKKRILILDDFGKIKSGEHLRVLTFLFSATTIFALVAAGGLYYRFSGLPFENTRLKEEVTHLGEKLSRLSQEKEVLLARLVISGKINAPEAAVTTDPKETAPREEPAIPMEKQGAGSNGQAPETVTIEKFVVTREGDRGDLMVRFDIRNISDKPGGISGRIFTVLKPDKAPQEEWLVIPQASLTNGIPAEYENGQYFSIVHFKPIKFKIENQAEPEQYKKAAIYVFSDNGDLVFEGLIDISEAEPS